MSVVKLRVRRAGELEDDRIVERVFVLIGTHELREQVAECDCKMQELQQRATLAEEALQLERNAKVDADRRAEVMTRLIRHDSACTCSMTKLERHSGCRLDERKELCICDRCYGILVE